MHTLDSRILTLIDELDRLGKTRRDAWQVPRVQGELLYQIAVTSGARLIVEVGTSYGFSGLFWGAAARRHGGALHTIDINPSKHDSARQTFARAGLSDVVTCHLGDARELLRGLPDGIDIAFLDADKPQTLSYFDQVWPKLRVGGSILTDNVGTHRTELGGYVQHVRTRPDASSVEVPVGNGMEWTVKLS